MLLSVVFADFLARHRVRVAIVFVPVGPAVGPAPPSSLVVTLPGAFDIARGRDLQEATV